MLGPIAVASPIMRVVDRFLSKVRHLDRQASCPYHLGRQPHLIFRRLETAIMATVVVIEVGVAVDAHGLTATIYSCISDNARC